MSINERELRTGNLVLRKDLWDSKVFKETVIGTNDITACSINNNSFQPIPLTEEWLVRMGFEKYSDNGEFTGNDCYYCKRNLIGAISLPDFRYRDYIKIKYVHQLQNLYLSLTGEELTIKE